MDDPAAYDFSRSTLVMVGWALVWLSILAIKLRNVEANHENIIIKTIRGRKTINYKNIKWISQIALFRPVLVSLKYYDDETGKSKKILFMYRAGFRTFRHDYDIETDMMGFIRAQVIKSKPDYSRDKEPSTWLPMILLMVSGIPIMIIVNIFFSSSI